MKTKYFLIILITCLFQACIGTGERETYSQYQPILMTRIQLERSVLPQSPRNPINPGKIYYKDNYIFINEKYKGVHIIDNKNPATPTNIGFIQAPGNIDIAIKNNSMYLDNSVDLVTVDISDINNPKIADRVKEVFPELTPPDGRTIPTKYTSANRPASTIIVGWEKQVQ